MARGKKKETILTPDEKLQQALVPESEWLYEVPGNWVYCRLGIVCDFERGITFPASAKETIPTGENIPCIRTANIQEELEIDDLIYVNKSYIKENGAKYTRINDIIMSSANSRELVGKTSLVKHLPFPMTFGGFVLTIRSQSINSKYLFYYLRLQFLLGKFMGESTQTTNIANINTSKLSGYVFPLSPLPEQQRIVDRIESLFAKLDEAKEKAQAVVDGFEDRKAAILHKAFTGELTEGWRKQEHQENLSWDKKRINQICFTRAGYAFDSKKFTNKGFQVIRMGNLYGGRLDLAKNPVFIDPKDIDEKVLNRSLINEGDILITLTGTKYKRDYGYAVCIRGQNNILVNQRILCLSPNSEIVTNYLLYYLQSNLFRDTFFSNETGGVNQGNVSSRFVENISIPLPTKKEQLEIVEKLDRILCNEIVVCEIAQNTVNQIDTMKKSILARAFRGELGTNDPSDESAEELLKRIL